MTTTRVSMVKKKKIPLKKITDWKDYGYLRHTYLKGKPADISDEEWLKRLEPRLITDSQTRRKHGVLTDQGNIVPHTKLGRRIRKAPHKDLFKFDR